MSRVLLLVVLGLVGVVAGASTATAYPRSRHHDKLGIRCPPTKQRVLASDTQVVVYEELELSNVFACDRKTKNSYYLGPMPYGGPSGYGGTYSITLAGQMIAYDYVMGSEGPSTNEIRVFDVVTGRLIHHFPSQSPPTSGEVGRGMVEAIAVKRDGTVAWTTYIVEKGPIKMKMCPPEECVAGPVVYQWETTYSAVHVLDRSGSHLIAYGTDIQPYSLGLAGSILYWTEGGKPFSVTLE